MTEPLFDCEDCIGMKEHGCYCAAVGAVAPGGPLNRETIVPCEACGSEGRVLVTMPVNGTRRTVAPVHTAKARAARSSGRNPSTRTTSRNALGPDQGLSEYIADFYGTCRLPRCKCNDREDPVGWRGRMCPNWQPVPATNWEELREWLEANADPRRMTGRQDSQEE